MNRALEKSDFSLRIRLVLMSTQQELTEHLLCVLFLMGAEDVHWSLMKDLLATTGLSLWRVGSGVLRKQSVKARKRGLVEKGSWESPWRNQMIFPVEHHPCFPAKDAQSQMCKVLRKGRLVAVGWGAWNSHGLGGRLSQRLRTVSGFSKASTLSGKWQPDGSRGQTAC